MHPKVRLLAATAFLAACVHVAPKQDPAQALLQQAIDAAGGEAVLTQARILIWSGTATVFAGDKKIELGVESRVEPFHSAQSDTWLRDQGRATLRTLQLDGDLGWTIRDGKRTPMPAQMARHEQLQYAVYGLMRLVTLREPQVVLHVLPADAQGRHGLRIQHPSAQDAELYFDSDGRLAYLTNHVAAPEGKGTLAQRFEFAGNIEGGGVRWPRIVRISQNGKPYFELRLQQFRTEP